MIGELGEETLGAFDVRGHPGLPDRRQAVTGRVECPVGIGMARQLEEWVGGQPPGLVGISLDPLPGKEDRRRDSQTLELIDHFPIVVGGNLVAVEPGQHPVGHVGVEGEGHPGTIPRPMADDEREPWWLRRRAGRGRARGCRR